MLWFIGLSGAGRCFLATGRKPDPKGPCRRADPGLIAEFTGVSSPGGAPEQPDLVLETEAASAKERVDLLWERLLDVGILAGE